MHKDRNLIFDIGMHIGQDTDFYLRKGFRVVAVEANPTLAEQGAERFASAIADGRLTIVNKAMANGGERVPFFINNEVTEWSSVHQSLGDRRHGSKEILVDSIDLATLFTEHGVPYYLKIDIEGADEIPIKQLRQCRPKPAYVSYEASSFGGAALLYAMGYRRFSVVLQRSVEHVVLPNPPAEGTYVDHTFPLGSSGPFGAEVASEWGTIDDAVREQVIWKNLLRHNPGKPDPWADIHAHHPGWAQKFDES